jgi:cytochrome P450
MAALLKERWSTGLICVPVRHSLRLCSNPYPFYRQLRQHSPIHYSSLIGGFVLSRYEDVVAAFSDSRLTSGIHHSRVWQAACRRDNVAADRLPSTHQDGHPLVLTDHQEHAQLRNLAASIVDRRWTPSFLAAIDDDVRSDLAGLCPGSHELMEAFVFPLVRSKIFSLLTIEDPFRDALREILRPGLTFAFHEGERLLRYPSIILRDPGAPARTRRQFLDLVTRMIATADRGLLSDLRIARDRGELAPMEATYLAAEMIVASFEPVAYQIGNILHAVAAMPGLSSQMLNHPRPLRDKIAELMRYDSAVQAVFRYAAADLSIRGQTVRQGDPVVLLLGAANRDSHQFHNADKIDFDRPNIASLAFGRGKHSCLGIKTARHILEEVVRQFLEKFPEIRLDGPVRWTTDLPMRGPIRLPCRLSC